MNTKLSVTHGDTQGSGTADVSVVPASWGVRLAPNLPQGLTNAHSRPFGCRDLPIYIEIVCLINLHSTHGSQHSVLKINVSRLILRRVRSFQRWTQVPRTQQRRKKTWSSWAKCSPTTITQSHFICFKALILKKFSRNLHFKTAHTP